MDLSIACTLTEAQLRQRRQVIMNTLRDIGVSVTELPDGYAYTFGATSDALAQVAQLVDLERQCCPFLTFKIVVEVAQAAMRLEVTGPGDAKALIVECFNFANIV
jgi:hypothetical protein